MRVVRGVQEPDGVERGTTKGEEMGGPREFAEEPGNWSARSDARQQSTGLQQRVQWLPRGQLLTLLCLVLNVWSCR